VTDGEQQQKYLRSYGVDKDDEVAISFGANLINWTSADWHITFFSV